MLPTPRSWRRGLTRRGTRFSTRWVVFGTDVTEHCGKPVLRSGSSLRVTRKSMRAGLSLERSEPRPAGRSGRFRWPPRPRKTYGYPLVVVLVLAVVVVVADLGDDRGLSYEQATLEQVGVERLVERFGRLGGQLGVDAP